MLNSIEQYLIEIIKFYLKYQESFQEFLDLAILLQNIAIFVFGIFRI